MAWNGNKRSIKPFICYLQTLLFFLNISNFLHLEKLYEEGQRYILYC